MTIRDAYTRWSATYDSDRNLTRDLDRHVTAATLGARRCQTVLELGCGTGKNTPFFAPIAQRVIAVDFSEGMLRTARAKLVSLPSVSFVMSDITRPWPIAPHTVDLISLNLVLEHVADLAPIFDEAARVLRPGGQLFGCELHPFRQYQGKKARFQHGAATTEIPAYVHHISTFIEQAERHDFVLRTLREWWHPEDDEGRPPRLVSFLFERR